MTLMGMLMLSSKAGPPHVWSIIDMTIAGLGNILSTPISTALSSSSSSIVSSDSSSDVSTTGFGVQGGKYEGMIVYVGSCFAGAAFVVLCGWVGERRGLTTAGRGI